MNCKMSTISTCPSCRKQVTIPAGVDTAAEVRCPLCDAKYALGTALAMAPPELIPVVPAAAVGSASAAEHTAPPPDVDEENEAASVAARLPATSVVAGLRARRSKSAVRTIMEVVLGGLAGCLVAYYTLALWFRSDFDKYLPKLPLPFISRLTEPPAGDGHATQRPPLEKPVDR